MIIIDARVRLPQDLRAQRDYAAPKRLTEQYDRVLDLTGKVNDGTLAALLTALGTHGIDGAVVHAETEGGEPANMLNDALGKLLEDKLLAERQGRFRGFGAVDLPPETPTKAARQAARAADDGFIGISVQPAFYRLDIDDRSLYPMYSRAEELGLIVALHTGISYSRMHPMRHERPELLDQVACDFPDLRLIACHAGWPWVTELCAVARRHPTVYLEFGGLAPKYVARPGTGWDTLFGMMRNVLRDQVLFGSDWPVMDQGRALAEWRGCGLPEPALRALLGGNAARLFGLGELA